MYTALDEEVFLAPESIISGVLAADLAHEVAVEELDLDADDAIEAAGLDLDALEA